MTTGGTWDISNADRLGMSEVQLCNLFIEGVAQVIRWEQALEEGKDIEAELAAAKPLGLDVGVLTYFSLQTTFSGKRSSNIFSAPPAPIFFFFLSWCWFFCVKQKQKQNLVIFSSGCGLAFIPFHSRD